MNYEEKAIEFVLNTFKKNTLKRLLIFGVPLLMLNIAFFIIASRLNELVALAVRYAIIALTFSAILAIKYWNYESIQKVKTMYSIELTLVSGKVEYICNEEELNKLLNWHESDEELYILTNPCKYTRITKSNLVELSYYEVSKVRQLIEPVLHVIYDRSAITFYGFIKLLFIGVITIAGYMLYKKIPLEGLLPNGMQFKWFESFQFSVLIIIVIGFAFQILNKATEIKPVSVTYLKTQHLGWYQSVIFNLFMIMAVPYIIKIVFI